MGYIILLTIAEENPKYPLIFKKSVLKTATILKSNIKPGEKNLPNSEVFFLIDDHNNNTNMDKSVKEKIDEWVAQQTPCKESDLEGFQYLEFERKNIILPLSILIFFISEPFLEVLRK